MGDAEEDVIATRHEKWRTERHRIWAVALAISLCFAALATCSAKTCSALTDHHDCKCEAGK